MPNTTNKIKVYCWANGLTADEDEVRIEGGLDFYMASMGVSDDYIIEYHDI